jgi:riboflavin biosynthesis pyrimidine reductase
MDSSGRDPGADPEMSDVSGSVRGALDRRKPFVLSRDTASGVVAGPLCRVDFDSSREKHSLADSQIWPAQKNNQEGSSMIKESKAFSGFSAGDIPKATGIVRDIEEIRKLKQQRGKNMHLVGGASLVGSLMNARLIDELQLMVNPLILGAGKALFKDLKNRQPLKFVKANPLKSGKIKLTYTTRSSPMRPTVA